MTRRRTGFSLMEMMVSLFLIGSIMTCLAVIMSAAVRYFITSNRIIEIQQNVLAASTAISLDLTDSDLNSLAPMGAPTTWAVLASPHESTGAVVYSGANITWQSYIGFYIDPATNNLYRKTTPIASPPQTPPAVPAAYFNTYFLTLNTNQVRLVATSIYEMDFFSDPNSLTFNLSVGAEDPDKQCILNVQTAVSPRN